MSFLLLLRAFSLFCRALVEALDAETDADISGLSLALVNEPVPKMEVNSKRFGHAETGRGEGRREGAGVLHPATTGTGGRGQAARFFC